MAQKISEGTGIELKESSRNEDSNIYKIKYAMWNSIKIYDFLYKDATIYLKRKHDKFIQFLAEKKENMRDAAVPFSLEEDEFIKNNFMTMRGEEISDAMNRSIDTIRHRAYRLMPNKRKLIRAV